MEGPYSEAEREREGERGDNLCKFYLMHSNKAMNVIQTIDM
jgi:hypothetical protein